MMYHIVCRFWSLLGLVSGQRDNHCHPFATLYATLFPPFHLLFFHLFCQLATHHNIHFEVSQSHMVWFQKYQHFFCCFIGWLLCSWDKSLNIGSRMLRIFLKVHSFTFDHLNCMQPIVWDMKCIMTLSWDHVLQESISGKSI